MKKRFTVLFSAAIVLACMVLVACPLELSSDSGPAAGAWGPEGSPFSGPASGSGQGFQSTVTVDMVLDQGVIREVTFGVGGETQAFVRRVQQVLGPRVIAANSFEGIPTNVVSGATTTVTALIQAGTAALNDLNQ